MTICIASKNTDYIEFACDSLMTCDDVQDKNAKKYKKVKLGYLLFAGYQWSVDRFITLHEDIFDIEDEKEFKIKLYEVIISIKDDKYDDFAIIFIRKDKIFTIIPNSNAISEDMFSAMGTGQKFANMCRGYLSIKKIVEICIDKDTYCGGDLFYKKIYYGKTTYRKLK